MCVLTRVLLLTALWTAARQAPLSMGVSRQEYWSGLPFPSPGDLPDPVSKPGICKWVLYHRATWEACEAPPLPRERGLSNQN